MYNIDENLKNFTKFYFANLQCFIKRDYHSYSLYFAISARSRKYQYILFEYLQILQQLVKILENSKYHEV